PAARPRARPGRPAAAGPPRARGHDVAVRRRGARARAARRARRRGGRGREPAGRPGDPPSRTARGPGPRAAGTRLRGGGPLSPRTRPVTALAAGLALLTVAGCAAGASGDGPVDPPEITLTFAGDVHFEDRVAELLDDPATTFGPVAAELADGDLTMVNRETPISTRGQAEDKRYLFRAPDAAVPALTEAGVDVVSLANNPSMDYGREALFDTVRTAEAGGLGTVGVGQDADEAFTALHRTVRGVDVAILAFSQVDDLADEWAATEDRSGMAMAFDTERVYAAVRE